MAAVYALLGLVLGVVINQAIHSGRDNKRASSGVDARQARTFTGGREREPRINRSSTITAPDL